MAPGPFSSIAAAGIAVVGLISSPFMYDRVVQPGPEGSAQERISAVIEQFKLQVKDRATATKEAVAHVTDDLRKKGEAPAATKAPKEVKVTTEAPATPPPTTTPPPATTPPPEPKQPEVKVTTQAPTTPPPTTTPTPKPKQPETTPPPKPTEPPTPEPKQSKEAVNPLVASMVHHLEVNVVAFERWCTGPICGYLRERLAEAMKASGMQPYLEKGYEAVGTTAQEYGMSTVAASITLSLALIADVLLIGFLVLWRLLKYVGNSRENARKKRLARIPKVGDGPGSPAKGKEESPMQSTPKKGKGQDAKAKPSPRSSPAPEMSPPSSGAKKKNGKKR